MNQKVVPVILAVADLVLAEGDIADDTIKKAVRELCCFKALNSDLILLIQLFCDPARDRIQLHAVHSQAAHALRDKSHEVADSATRLQHIAGGQAHVPKCLIHGLDDRWRSVKGVQRRGSGLPVFLRRQRRLDLRKLASPFPTLRVKGFGNAAPTYKVGQHFLFLRRCQSALVFQCF